MTVGNIYNYRHERRQDYQAPAIEVCETEGQPLLGSSYNEELDNIIEEYHGEGG